GPDEDQKPERIAIDREHRPAERPHLAGRIRRRGIPGETSLHGDEHGGDHPDGADTDSSPSLGERHDDKLSSNSMRITELRDGAPLGLQPIAGGICADGLPKMALDLL